MWATRDAPYLLNGRPEITIVADEISDPRRAPYGPQLTLADPAIWFLQSQFETGCIGDTALQKEKSWGS